MKIAKLINTKNTGREVLGTILISKLDEGKEFSVTDIDVTNGTVTATEVLPEDAPEGTVAKVVVITKEMEDSFSYLRNPNPKVVPVATVANGSLMIGSDPVSMGDYVAYGVVAVKENEVLLTATTTEDEDVFLCRYLVDEDKFLRLPFPVGDISSMVVDGIILIQNTITKEIQQKDKDGNPILDDDGDPVTKIELTDNYIGQWLPNGTISFIQQSSNAYPDEWDDYGNYDGDGEGTDPILPVDLDKATVTSFGDRKTLVLTSDKTYDEDGYLVPNDGKTTVYLVKVTEAERMGDVISSGYPLSTEILGKDPFVKITFDGRSVGWLIKTDEQLILSKKGTAFETTKRDVIEALAGYNNYIGVYKKKEVVDDDKIVEVTRHKFANDKYISKAVVLRPLGDGRGFDISVE